MSPALEGEFLTTGPPGKSLNFFEKALSDSPVQPGQRVVALVAYGGVMPTAVTTRGHETNLMGSVQFNSLTQSCPTL